MDLQLRRYARTNYFLDVAFKALVLLGVLVLVVSGFIAQGDESAFSVSLSQIGLGILVVAFMVCVAGATNAIIAYRAGYPDL